MINKEFFQGLIASFFASSSAMIFLLLYFSEAPIEDGISYFFKQKKIRWAHKYQCTDQSTVVLFGNAQEKNKFC